MKAKDILNHKRHRSFDIPDRPWKYYQEWNKALFLHWEVKPEAIQELLPDGLKVDCIDDKTWISLVAFDMNNIGIKNIPKMPHISDFHEINIRVYVTYKNKPSVYFLSLEGSKKSSCSMLRFISKFPYRYSKMKRNLFSYTSHNSVLKESFYTEFKQGKKSFIKDETDLWLTERYAVFQDYKNKLIEYNVHHVEWPIEDVKLLKLDVNYQRFNHLINTSPHRVHYSSGVQVLTWDKEIIS